MKNTYGRLILAVLCVCWMCVGCGGSGGDGPTSPTVATLLGTWNGAWISDATGASGTVVIRFEQGANGFFSGTATYVGSPCFTEATFTGILTGNAFAMDVSVDGVMMLGHSGSLSDDNSQATGIYTVTGPGACQGDTGTWTATKQ